MRFEEFNELLKSWTQKTVHDNPIIESIIQFGSTCKEPIKKETDVDLLYIINLPSKPSRPEIYELTKNWDGNLEKELARFPDHNIVVNSHVKIPQQLDHLSPMYLDFIDCGNILFDRHHLGAELFANIQTWIRKNNAKKINKGALWYWIYDDKDPSIPVDFKFDTKK